MIKEVFPKSIQFFNSTDKLNYNKIFLYSDRDIFENEIKYNEKSFEKIDLGSFNDIDLPGQVENPSHSLERALYSSYEWSSLDKNFYDGVLFCFIDFFPDPLSEIKQLKFRAYPLKEEHN